MEAEISNCDLGVPEVDERNVRLEHQISTYKYDINTDSVDMTEETRISGNKNCSNTTVTVSQNFEYTEPTLPEGIISGQDDCVYGSVYYNQKDDKQINDPSHEVKTEITLECHDLCLHRDVLTLFPFVCGICDKKFNNVLTYFVHISTHENMNDFLHSCNQIVGNVSTESMYSCGICNIKYPSLCTLYQHLLEAELVSNFIYKSRERTAYAYEEPVTNVTGNSQTTYFDNIGADSQHTTKTVEWGTAYLNDGSEPELKECNDNTNVSTSTMVRDSSGKKQELAVGNRKTETHKYGKSRKSKLKYNEKSKSLAKERKKSDTTINDSNDYVRADGKQSRTKTVAETTDVLKSHKRDKSKAGKDAISRKKIRKKVRQRTVDLESLNTSVALSTYDMFGEIDATSVLKQDTNVGDETDVVKEETDCVMDATDDFVDETDDIIGEADDVNEETDDINSKRDTWSSKTRQDKKYFTKKRMTNSRRDQLYPCEVCGAVFKYQYLLKHRTTHDACTIACDECDNVYNCKFRLKTHKKQVHTHEKGFTCDECGKGFKAWPYLKQHRQVHIKERNIQCPECPMKFKYAAVLRAHMKTHSDEKPYSCEQCGMTFKRADLLTNHKKYHSDEKNFQCPECSKLFKTKQDMKKHHRIHLPPKFFCEVCNKGFIQKHNMRTHLKVHGIFS